MGFEACYTPRRRGWPGYGEEFEVPLAMLVSPKKKFVPSSLEFINYYTIAGLGNDVRLCLICNALLLQTTSHLLIFKTITVSRVRFVLLLQGGCGFFPPDEPNETECDECKTDQGTNDNTGDRPL